MHKKLLMALGAVLALALPASALAAVTVKITTGFSPNKHGKGTHIQFRLDATDAANMDVPAPGNVTVVHLPKGVVINSKGFPTCSQTVLNSEPLGAPGSKCPRKSIVGSGHSIGGILTPATPTNAPLVVRSNLTVVAAVGPPQRGNTVLLLHVTANKGSLLPLNFVIPGVLSKDTGKYSYKFSFAVPHIPTLPGLPNGSILEFDTNIGASIKVHGKTVNLTTEPTTCPKGGFNWGADFTYFDGERYSTTAKSAC